MSTKKLGTQAKSAFWKLHGSQSGNAEDAPLIGGLFTSGKDDNAKSSQILDDITKQYQGLKTPGQKNIQYEDQSWLQNLTPEQVNNVLQGDSAMGNISTDPRLKQDQMASLEALRSLAASGGMNAQDTANLSKLNSDVGTADKGRRDAIVQGMHQRGQGGSGMELLAQLQSNQAATDRQAQGSLDVAGMAQDRALQAIQQGGQMAGNMQQQDFGQQAQIAQARDAISRFNTGNMNQNNQFNAGQAQQANMYNNQGAQTVSNGNVANRNQATQQNHGNAQQNFENQRSVIDGQAGAMGAQAKQ